MCIYTVYCTCIVLASGTVMKKRKSCRMQCFCLEDRYVHMFDEFFAMIRFTMVVPPLVSRISGDR